MQLLVLLKQSVVIITKLKLPTELSKTITDILNS